MGSRGPVPKRSDQRRRTNQDEGPITTKQAARVVRVPAADRTWHPLAQKWYKALRNSGQAEMYEPSDWAEAQVWAHVLSEQLLSDKLSAMMLAAWGAASARLMVTEGDRRRMRLELERGKPEDPDADAGVASMDSWRQKLAGGAS